MSDDNGESDAHDETQGNGAAVLDADAEAVDAVGATPVAPALDEIVEEAGVDYTPRAGLVDAVEALAFVSQEALTIAKVREVYSLDGVDVPAPEVKRAFKELLEKWSDPARPLARGFTLLESGGGLRFRTEVAQATVVRRMFAERPQRLSRAALETLAIIAYRQPLTRPQVDEVRGVDSSGALKALLDRRLVRVLGKADDVGRPLLYGTTKTFLEFFGLQSLRDLPTLKQIQELDDNAIRPVLLADEERAAVVMDLFDPSRDRLVTAETEGESLEALQALEEALGKAAAVAKRAGPLPSPLPQSPGGDEGGDEGEPSVEGASAAAASTSTEGEPLAEDDLDRELDREAEQLVDDDVDDDELAAEG